MRKTNEWDRAKELTVCRTSPCATYSGPIDNGVNFFVLMLEKLKATPQYSCEGHPQGFYVVFTAPIATALKIVQLGYFRVELERKNTKKDYCWSLRANFDNEEQKRQFLRLAAAAWVKAFGNLKALENENQKGNKKSLRTCH